MDRLYDAGIRVPASVGRVETSGQRIVTFSEFVGGGQAERFTAADGQLFAQLHALEPDSDIRPYDPFYLVDQELTHLQRLVASGQFDGQAFERVQEYYSAAKALHEMRSSGTRHSIIHGDLWHGNLLRSPSGESVLIDFERAGRGVASYELTRGLLLTTHRPDPFHLRPQGRDFLAGYRAWGGVADEELAHELLPIFDLVEVLRSTRKGIISPAWAAEAEHRRAGLYIKDGLLRGKDDYMWNEDPPTPPVDATEAPAAPVLEAGRTRGRGSPGGAAGVAGLTGGALVLPAVVGTSGTADASVGVNSAETRGHGDAVSEIVGSLLGNLDALVSPWAAAAGGLVALGLLLYVRWTNGLPSQPWAAAAAMWCVPGPGAQGPSGRSEQEVSASDRSVSDSDVRSVGGEDGPGRHGAPSRLSRGNMAGDPGRAIARSPVRRALSMSAAELAEFGERVGMSRAEFDVAGRPSLDVRDGLNYHVVAGNGVDDLLMLSTTSGGRGSAKSR